MLLFYLSLYASNSILGVLFVVPCILYVLFALLVRESKYRREFLQVNLAASVLMAILIPSVVECWNLGYRFHVAFYLLTTASVVSAFAVVLKDTSLPDIKSWVKDNYVKLIIAFVALVASGIYIYCHHTYYMWDFHLMYDVIDSREAYHLLILDKLSLAAHIDYSYVAICTVLKFLFKSTMLGMKSCGVVLYFLGLYGFWKCLGIFDKDGKVSVRVMCEVMFAVSPYVLGMITYSYLDYALWCLTPLLTYTVLTRKYMWSVVFSSFYVFCKEPAILIYSFFIAGVYLDDAIKNKKIVIDIRRYIVFLLPCFLWVFSYLFVGHWAGGGAFELSGSYIAGKLKSTYLINFNYLLLILAVVAVVISFAKHREDLSVIIPILSSFVAYSAFTLVFVTVDHTRYIDSILAQINLLAAMCILKYMPHLKVKYVITVILSGLMLLSCFYTVDPLMLLAHKRYDMGGTTMISTNRYLSDGMVYNFQYQNIGAAMDEAWAGALVQDNVMIYMPAINNNTWYTNTMGTENPMNGQSEIVVYELWNAREETRMTSRFDVDSIVIPVHYVTDEYDFDPVQTNYFFYYNGAGEDVASKIFSEYYYETDEFESNGVIVYRVKFWR